ncbi:hypothetical protein [Chryseobacterium indoltheticum]|uniref:hypothetical protein n=1 Tax=Chryseobacterium indoltheticum TaxID=254 RepID=UPI003F494C0A
MHGSITTQMLHCLQPRKSTNYDVSNWAVGNGPLGYGDPVTTSLVSGVDTAYLIKDFTVNLADLTNTMEFGGEEMTGS